VSYGSGTNNPLDRVRFFSNKVGMIIFDLFYRTIVSVEKCTYFSLLRTYVRTYVRTCACVCDLFFCFFVFFVMAIVIETPNCRLRKLFT